MPTYKIMRCPFCKGIWAPRGEIVVSCTKCKRRFDYPGKEVEPEIEEIEFRAYSCMKKWLFEADKVAKKNGSMTLKQVLKLVPPHGKASEDN